MTKNEPRYRPNPFASADLFGEGEAAELVVRAPVRGRGFVVSRVARKDEPALFDLIRDSLESERGVSRQRLAAHRERLLQLGLLLPFELLPRSEPRFACFLAAPPRSIPIAPALRVNPSLRFLPEGQLPDGVAAETTAAFLPGHPIAWIRDAYTDVWLPYWIRAELAPVLAQLVPGQPPPAQDADVIAQLCAAQILLPCEVPAEAPSSVETAHREFAGSGYSIMRGLLPAPMLAALQKYYRELCAEGFVTLGDRGSARRYAQHNELLARYFHQQFSGFMQRIAGAAITPSYVYFASYLPGAVLGKHVDREQCEYSISLLIDFTPAPEGPCGWPLHLSRELPTPVAAAADLAIGDGLFYRGRELTHHRDPLGEAQTSSSLFLHYVPADFQGPLD